MARRKTHRNNRHTKRKQPTQPEPETPESWVGKIAELAPLVREFTRLVIAVLRWWGPHQGW